MEQFVQTGLHGEKALRGGARPADARSYVYTFAPLRALVTADALRKLPAGRGLYQTSAAKAMAVQRMRASSNSGATRGAGNSSTSHLTVAGSTLKWWVSKFVNARSSASSRSGAPRPHGARRALSDRCTTTKRSRTVLCTHSTSLQALCAPRSSDPAEGSETNGERRVSVTDSLARDRVQLASI
jgi:hypothetical protein